MHWVEPKFKNILNIERKITYCKNISLGIKMQVMTSRASKNHGLMSVSINPIMFLLLREGDQ